MVIRSKSDPAHLARVTAMREHLGVGEDVRVEELTPLEFLRLQAEQAHRRMTEAREAWEKAKVEYDKAYGEWQLAERFVIKAEEDEGGNRS